VLLAAAAVLALVGVYDWVSFGIAAAGFTALAGILVLGKAAL
jgi:hypothetical protein